MVDLVLVAAVLVLGAAVVACFVPLAPAGLLSLAGVYGYWWATGWGSPGVPFVAAATVVALTVVAVDWLGGVVSARAGGAATSTALVAGAVGLLLTVLLTPVGGLVGVIVTVFVLEVYRGAAAADGARTALVTLVGLLASSVIQALLTGAILVGFLLTAT